MRLISFQSPTGPAIGVISDDKIVDLSLLDSSLPKTMAAFIASGEAGMALAKKAAETPPSEACLALQGVELLPVVTDPSKVVCVGLNYADHAAEGGNDFPEYPGLFLRTTQSLIGHGSPIVRPACSDTLDYEAELLVVIGKGGRHISQDRALEHVFGYSVFNDASVRAYQRLGAQWTPGKNFDNTGAAGPWIVTADELPAGAIGLAIQSRLNGKVMQDSNTENKIFSVARIIEIVSEVMTLNPGDLIAMGTPEGVGYARKPPVFMQPGDIIEVEIEKIGILSNPIKAEAV